jgi:epoxyqueuosine reductase
MKLTNDIVIQKAKAIGFDLIGFTKVDELDKETERLTDWLDHNYQGGMNYMERNIDKRKNVSQILPDAKSIISLALNYYTEHQHSQENNVGKVSRYAWGKDYHLIIWDMLEGLETELKNVNPEFNCKSYVDTGPMMDKAWAIKAGIGWMGKHSNIINRGFGSWFFIANIITNSEFEYSNEIPDYCGSCTACIDACPTDAIVSDYVVDSNKCISYLTIENKGDIPQEFSSKFDGWLFGCDICQDVCPWNIKFAQPTSIKDFKPKNGNKEIPLENIIAMENEEFKKRFSESPILRTKLKGLKRNAKFLKQGCADKHTKY